VSQSEEAKTTGPITDAEVAEWVNNLSPEDKVELRRAQLQHRAISQAEKEAPDFASMSDQALQEFMRKNGFYR
jgi:hypothetical protein